MLDQRREAYSSIKTIMHFFEDTKMSTLHVYLYLFIKIPESEEGDLKTTQRNAGACLQSHNPPGLLTRKPCKSWYSIDDDLAML